jgi:hypothetical protein
MPSSAHQRPSWPPASSFKASALITYCVSFLIEILSNNELSCGEGSGSAAFFHHLASVWSLTKCPIGFWL